MKERRDVVYDNELCRDVVGAGLVIGIQREKRLD